jgi:hypothetical protein
MFTNPSNEICTHDTPGNNPGERLFDLCQSPYRKQRISRRFFPSQEETGG